MRELLRRYGVIFSVSIMLCTTFAVQAEQSNTPESVKEQSGEVKKQVKPDIEWGTWDQQKAPLSRYGVGISGKIEAELSRLDRSNLLDNAGGVEVQNQKQNNSSKPKDIKRMMAELEAMEAEIKQEINDESEF